MGLMLLSLSISYSARHAHHARHARHEHHEYHARHASHASHARHARHAGHAQRKWRSLHTHDVYSGMILWRIITFPLNINHTLLYATEAVP